VERVVLGPIGDYMPNFSILFKAPSKKVHKYGVFVNFF